jgi:hypothetical protein
MAPSVSPAIKNLLRIRYTTIMGMIEILIPASAKSHEDAAIPDVLRLITPTTRGMLMGLEIVKT